MLDELIAVPETIRDRVALDRTSNTLYTDRRFASNHILLSWVARNKDKNIDLNLRLVEVDELATLREGGLGLVSDQDQDMAVRANAISILQLTAAYGASDLHFMLRGTHTEVQVQVKGALKVLIRLTHMEGEQIVRSIYQGISKTRDSSFNELEFQNAQIAGDALNPEANVSSIRIVRGPAYPQEKGGAFMTLRFQYGPRSDSADWRTRQLQGLPPLELPRAPAGEFRLPIMGYSNPQIEKLRGLFDAPNGIVLFTGPTGAGKTTTMFEALQESARTKPHRRLVTIEDPIENPMPWAVQLFINNARTESETGEAYQERLRVALRMAPHSVLLGELRGADVALTALTAAVTGHLIISTMHTNDPFLFVERLELMDRTRLDRRTFCDHKIIRGVVAQRLLPRLCPHCSKSLTSELLQRPDVVPASMVAALKTWGDIGKVRIKGDGCKRCSFDGTLDRFAVAEVVVMDACVMRDFIQHGSEVARINYRARPDADPSMLETALKFAFEGQVDPRSVNEDVDVIEHRPPQGLQTAQVSNHIASDGGLSHGAT